jgi:P27 family predicted phage terminase small subunit
MRGRKPQPTGLKILKGTRDDRVNHDEPAPPPGMPEPPDHLDKLGRQEWARICELLASMGIGSKADAPALMLYCTSYSKWLRARGDIAKHGLTVLSKHGLRANPAVNIELTTARLMKDLLVEFGLTPSSRSRIKTTSEKPRDALEEFLVG